MKNTPIKTAHVLVIQKGKVLLVKHGEKAGHLTNTYGIPGGRQEPSETFTQTACREFLEETGLKVLEKDLRPFPGNTYTADIHRKEGVVKRYTMIIFLSRVFSGTLKKSEETEPEWIKIEDLEKVNLLPNVKTAIFYALDFLKNNPQTLI